jgi:glycosyltransferase involved in cell wall biosynthesis
MRPKTFGQKLDAFRQSNTRKRSERYRSSDRSKKDSEATATHRERSILRTLHIISSIQRRYGGPPEVLKRLAGELRNSGHVIDVICLDDPADVDEDDSVFARVIRLGHRAGRYRFNLQLLRWLKEHVEEYDAIVVDGLWQFHSVAAWLSLRPRNIPFYVVPHGMLDPSSNDPHGFRHLKKLVYWMLIERHVIAHAKAVIFTAQSERELARKTFPLYKATEALAIPGTAPPPASTAKNIDVGQQRPTRTFGTRKMILFLGRIHEVKGCDLLIRSFSDLRSCGHDYQLVIAGPDENGLEARLKVEAAALGMADAITWTGMIRSADKWPLLRAADALILPSHHENFGMVVAEALACGVPALLTNKVGVWQQVVADGAGFADDDTREGITRLLIRWAQTPDADKAEMRCAAERCFNDRFHVRHVARNYVALMGGLDEMPLPAA